MKIDKITLSDESIKFLSEKTSKNNTSLREAINEWNHKQEIKKYLNIGDIVKIKTNSDDNNNGKKGFIGEIPMECGFSPDPEKSGKFLVFGKSDNDLECYGDYLGYELLPTGIRISKDDLINFMNGPNLHDDDRKILKIVLEEHTY